MNMDALLSAIANAKTELEKLEMQLASDGKPDPSPEHEAAEPPDVEALEHAMGVEMSDEPEAEEDDEKKKPFPFKK